MKSLIGENCHWSRRKGCSGDCNLKTTSLDADNSSPTLPVMVLVSKSSIDVLAVLTKTDTATNEFIGGRVSYPRLHQGHALAVSAQLKQLTKHLNVQQLRLCENRKEGMKVNVKRRKSAQHDTEAAVSWFRWLQRLTRVHLQAYLPSHHNRSVPGVKAL